MVYKIKVTSPSTDEELLLEICEELAPKTVKEFLQSLPLEINGNVWGEEIYTDETSIKSPKENPKSLVQLFDVAFWPPGKAICLFFGPTPISQGKEIRPYSEVNVIGNIVSKNKNFLETFKNQSSLSFSLIT